MKKKKVDGNRYTWTKHGSFNVGISESSVFVKTSSGNLQLKLDFTSSSARHIKEFFDKKEFTELENYIQYLFSVIMLFGDNDYFSEVMKLTLQHVDNLQNKKSDESSQELSGDSE